MTNNPTPQILNWVEKRATCTLAVMFKELEAGVRSDVEEMKKQYPKESDRFDFVSQHNFFSVIRRIEDIMGLTQTVDFALSRRSIKVQDGEKLWTADIGLNKEGRCLLRVDDEEMEKWQFRKMVLERLFFGPWVGGRASDEND